MLNCLGYNCNNPTFIAENYPQKFSTPRYPLPYPWGTDCEWNIKTNSINETILLKFFDVDLGIGFKVIEVSITVTFQLSFTEPRLICTAIFVLVIKLLPLKLKQLNSNLAESVLMPYPEGT